MNRISKKTLDLAEKLDIIPLSVVTEKQLLTLIALRLHYFHRKFEEANEDYKKELTYYKEYDNKTS